ncbi:coiled-coil and C2 domain-containing protein 1B isoform X2 [Notamacropus eugenii]|uniref:coiled-coil and C2 domain-containing protein 1B isoform X2 n=1 Tax=Notamacropus eugenii TaxID=9315 RepID=UPI003B6773C3
MPGPRPRKGPQARGQGVAAAKQLGLFVEFSPEDMMLEAQDDGEDDGDLEAELLALTGDSGAPESKARPKRKVPLPMAHIEKLAAECLQDVGDEASDEEDEELEADTDLLAELQEVLGEEDEGEEDSGLSSPEQALAPTRLSAPAAPEVVPTAGGLQGLLEERIANYQAAAASAREAGDGAKARRCERGLKTLQTQLTAVKKGQKINEEEIPPPVACGKRPELPPPAESEGSGEPPTSPDPPATSDPPATPDSPPTPGPSTTPDLPSTSAPPEAGALEPDSLLLLLTRQKEYKAAALKAKQEGDLERARECMRIGKRFGAVLEALESGQPVDLSGMPPAPSELKVLKKSQLPPSPGSLEHSKPVMSAPTLALAPPPQPQTVLEALGQRLGKYQEAAAQAKSSGDVRKARMHERIAKQYQEAIRAHKAGRKVNLAELPVPPGFPPIPGLEPSLGSEDNPLAAALKAAQLLGGQEEKDEDEDEEEPLTQAPVAKKPAQRPSQAPQVARPSGVPSPEPKGSTSQETLSQAAREQLASLESRKLQCQRAALQAKRAKDLEQAKAHLRAAKALDTQIALVRSGGRVGSSGTKVSSSLTDEDGGFVLIRHEDLGLSQKAEEVYAQLHKMLQEQQEKCLLYSKQFMHQGNVAETTRFEKLAQDRKRQLEILQLAQAQGLDPPGHRFEEKTFQTVRIFSELNSTEMHLLIVRGMNLPAPPGVTPDDLDAFVRFEFHYPSSDQAQKSKTSVVKNTNSPEFDQLFKLNINRNHRGFRRLVQNKGIKFEIFHKGSFFRSDKQVGTAHLKLERLETECEIREILEVLDGRKPTGGKLEVKVRLREPLSGQDMQTVTENWLVLEPRGL